MGLLAPGSWVGQSSTINEKDTASPEADCQPWSGTGACYGSDTKS